MWYLDGVALRKSLTKNNNFIIWVILKKKCLLWRHYCALKEQFRPIVVYIFT